MNQVISCRTYAFYFMLNFLPFTIRVLKLKAYGKAHRGKSMYKRFSLIISLLTNKLEESLMHTH